MRERLRERECDSIRDLLRSLRLRKFFLMRNLALKSGEFFFKEGICRNLEFVNSSKGVAERSARDRVRDLSERCSDL
jgi:hypothetical protein